jgi:hypothetical protein
LTVSESQIQEVWIPPPPQYLSPSVSPGLNIQLPVARNVGPQPRPQYILVKAPGGQRPLRTANFAEEQTQVRSFIPAQMVGGKAIRVNPKSMRHPNIFVTPLPAQRQPQVVRQSGPTPFMTKPILFPDDSQIIYELPGPDLSRGPYENETLDNLGLLGRLSPSEDIRSRIWHQPQQVIPTMRATLSPPPMEQSEDIRSRAWHQPQQVFPAMQATLSPPPMEQMQPMLVMPNSAAFNPATFTLAEAVRNALASIPPELILERMEQLDPVLLESLLYGDLRENQVRSERRSFATLGGEGLWAQMANAAAGRSTLGGGSFKKNKRWQNAPTLKMISLQQQPERPVQQQYSNSLPPPPMTTTLRSNYGVVRNPFLRTSTVAPGVRTISTGIPRSPLVVTAAPPALSIGSYSTTAPTADAYGVPQSPVAVRTPPATQERNSQNLST